jgi:prepilin-type N-terminal cleavage/methylation domain-containing protein
MTGHIPKKRGFTLIETLVYLSLFSLIMGGAVIAAYQMFESGGRNQTRAMLQEEGDFVEGKLSWAMSGVQTISAPGLPPSGVNCATSSTLSVAKWDATVGTVVVSALSGYVTLSRGGSSTQPLNNTNTVVSGLTFAHCYSGSANPESISADFTLTTRTPNGMSMSQDFSTKQYVRK